ncbi:Peptidase family M50 [Gimesia panareensis]|uniref:Peptidase family M50 n=1 Tax=Gimesia panareensis TaxID=2527978 RepID=A0A518FT85_9PLAN|nr:efflux RND transporter periplasmic adaptor subunit [Gimesia panareensis]QDV19558.1 Peptidase family M50 [Gimesia panareensis]
MNAEVSIRDFFSGCLKVREDLTFTFQNTNGEEYYTVNDSLHSRYYRIGLTEYTFLRLLDGRSTVQECYSRLSTALPFHTLSQNDIVSLCQWAFRNNLVRNQDERLCSRTANGQQSAAFLSKLNLIVFRCPIGNPDRCFTRLERSWGWLFTAPARVIWGFILLWALFRIGLHWTEFYNSSRTILSTDNWIWLAGCWVVLKLCHESAHGIVCKRYGGTVREAGSLFVLFAPLPYVDVTSCWSFPSRRARIHVAAAGMYIELLIAALAACLWGQTSEAWLNQLCFNIVFTASVTSLLFNLNPLMKFDGYYILVDLLGIPNLYTNGQLWIQQWAKRTFLGVKTLLPDWSPRVRLIIAGYGIASLIWRSMVCISLIVAAATLLEGAGVILALIAVGLWIVQPAWRCASYIACGRPGEAPQRMRFILTSGAMLLLTSLLLIYVPWFGNFQAPAIVEYAPLGTRHAEMPGFIQKIYVESGQLVQAGQPLVQLQNPELNLEISKLKIEIQQSELRIHQYEQKRQIADRQVEQEVLQDLETQLKEKQKLSTQLTIRSEINGRVVTRNLEAKCGTYVNQGDVIITIGDDRHKELHIAVAQDELDHFMNTPSRHVMAHVPQLPLLSCPVKKVVPRATVTLSHPALAAACGGPLPVKPVASADANSQYELLEPRFNLIVSISTDKSEALHAGQRVDVTCRPHDYSIGQHLYHSFTNWLYQRLDQ